MSAPSPGASGELKPGLNAILRNRSAVAFLAAVFLITVGVTAQVTALGKQVFDLTRRELDLGLLGLFEFLPALLLVVMTGSVADRFDRRRVAAIGLMGEAVALLGLAYIASQQRPGDGVAAIFSTVLLFGVFRAFAAPATRALPASIVAPTDLPRVIALNATMWQVGLIIGPIAGGLLYTWSKPAPYVLAGGCCVVGAAILLTVRYHATDVAVRRVSIPTGGQLRDAMEGLRAIRRHPVLLGAVSLDLFAVLFGGAIALLPAIATDRLNTDAAGLGWLRAAVGIGAGVVTIALAIRPLDRHIGRWLFISVAVFGAAHIGLGLTTSFAVAFGFLLVASAFDAVSVFVRATLLPLVTPNSIRGRVLAVEAVFIGASNELGAFESGVAGELMGAAGAIVFGGVATLVVVAICWNVFPALRDIDRFPVRVSDLESMP